MDAQTLSDQEAKAEPGTAQPASLKPAGVTLPRRHPILEAFRAAEYGQLSLDTPEGQTLVFEGAQSGPVAHLCLHDWRALDGLLAYGEVGFAEAYMDRLWDSRDLSALIAYGLCNTTTVECHFKGRPFYALWAWAKSLLQVNSLAGSRRNIKAHYDLGNEFYKLWLDDSMTYSCAIFGNDPERTLEAAQQAKYQRILNKLGVKPGDHILEIGCGWGGFAEAAARRGIRVTGVTISEEQSAFAVARLQQAGLSDLATIKLVDYREIAGQFDHIVSIGMFEHVGQSYWPVYFDTIKSHLKPGCKAMIQTITIVQEVFERNANKNGFIRQMIFPGGCLPSYASFCEAVQKAKLECREIFAFGQDYARTMTHWMHRFNKHEAGVRRLGHDDAFVRMWRLYLSCCIAAFTIGRTNVVQAELTHATP